MQSKTFCCLYLLFFTFHAEAILGGMGVKWEMALCWLGRCYSYMWQIASLCLYVNTYLSLCIILSSWAKLKATWLRSSWARLSRSLFLSLCLSALRYRYKCTYIYIYIIDVYVPWTHPRDQRGTSLVFPPVMLLGILSDCYFSCHVVPFPTFVVSNFCGKSIVIII
jgi:hypothetical protein